jgi:hypothetical protein
LTHTIDQKRGGQNVLGKNLGNVSNLNASVKSSQSANESKPNEKGEVKKLKRLNSIQGAVDVILEEGSIELKITKQV